MSNPAVITLVNGIISNKTRVRIEDNLGESIHIHLNNHTFYLSVNEFEHLVEAFTEATRELLLYEGIILDDFDISSFDWDWLKRYRKIVSITKRMVKLRDLYTSNLYYYDNYTSREYVSVQESHYYKTLEGDSKALLRYKLPNMYGYDNIRRSFEMLGLIKNYGYPFDDKNILVNQYGVIYDGVHRAAALLYLYGGDYVIPVKMLDFEDEISPLELNKIQKKRIKQFQKKEAINTAKYYFEKLRCINLSTFYKAIIRRMEKKSIDNNVNKKDNKTTTYDMLIQGMRDKCVRFFLLNKPKYDNICNRLADEIIIIHEEDYSRFETEVISDLEIICDKSIYQDYSLLYSIDAPLLVRLVDKCILVYFRMCCKSLDEKALLPLDSSIIERGWKTIKQEHGLPTADEYTTLICVLLDSILEQKAFLDHDKDYIRKNKGLLQREELKILLRKEFFSFTNELVELLEQEKFEQINDRYLSFCDY